MTPILVDARFQKLIVMWSITKSFLLRKYPKRDHITPSGQFDVSYSYAIRGLDVNPTCFSVDPNA